MSSFSGFEKTPEPVSIQPDPFWPAIDVAEFTAAYRIPGDFAQQTVQTHVELATLWVQRQLSTWQIAQQGQGQKTLEDGGQALLYRHAVSCRAKSALMQEFRPMTRSNGAKGQMADMGESSAAEEKWAQFANEAIADFLGHDRMRVRLI